jgi:NADPH-dependent 2,4-dienoyl-CoA reductase/sulfur reductase-like enzyme
VDGPSSVVILGAGAAGHAAAETLRLEGYGGPVTLIGADASEPYDRPNLSKDYLAGQAPEEWIPLRDRESYADRKIELRTGVRATRIDATKRLVFLSDGHSLSYGALLLAMGAEPVRLDVPGASLPHVHYLRTLADSRAIIERAKGAKRVVVVGASFIGLEVAASLRARGLDVRVVGREAKPLGRVLGPELGDFVRALHEESGVTFHLGRVVTAIDAARGVSLDTAEVLPADLVVVGIGVRPVHEIAEAAGLTIDRGVRVNGFLETSAPVVWAAGDLARWPDPRSGEDVRVEHWVVAQRLGQTAARNILGKGERFDAVPFFWTRQFGVTISYVGHAPSWDRTELDGSLAARDCAVRFRKGGRTVAVATVGRDRESLRAELEMESRTT